MFTRNYTEITIGDKVNPISSSVVKTSKQARYLEISRTEFGSIFKNKFTQTRVYGCLLHTSVVILVMRRNMCVLLEPMIFIPSTNCGQTAITVKYFRRVLDHIGGSLQYRNIAVISMRYITCISGESKLYISPPNIKFSPLSVQMY